jgi:hypothetical protein
MNKLIRQGKYFVTYQNIKYQVNLKVSPDLKAMNGGVLPQTQEETQIQSQWAELVDFSYFCQEQGSQKNSREGLFLFWFIS